MYLIQHIIYYYITKEIVESRTTWPYTAFRCHQHIFLKYYLN